MDDGHGIEQKHKVASLNSDKPQCLENVNIDEERKVSRGNALAVYNGTLVRHPDSGQYSRLVLDVFLIRIGQLPVTELNPKLWRVS